MAEHCIDNSADRALGKYWERRFCIHAADHGLSFTPMQIDLPKAAQVYARNGHGWQQYTLPDVTVWTYPGQYHEIKHNDPTRRGMFGLEAYRFNALLWFAEETGQDVMYTIHNHALSGGRDSELDLVEHWFTADIQHLDGQWAEKRRGPSWIDGRRESRVLTYYWPVDLWSPLSDYWQVQLAMASEMRSYPLR